MCSIAKLHVDQLYRQPKTARPSQDGLVLMPSSDRKTPAFSTWPRDTCNGQRKSHADDERIYLSIMRSTSTSHSPSMDYADPTHLLAWSIRTYPGSGSLIHDNLGL